MSTPAKLVKPPGPKKPGETVADARRAAVKLGLAEIVPFRQKASQPLASQTQRTEPPLDEAVTTVTRSVLLIEPDEEISRLLSKLLAREGCRVTTATGLAAARMILEKDQLVVVRRDSLPLDLEAEKALHELETQTKVQIVDHFSDWLAGQAVDYLSMSDSYLSLLDLLMSQLEGANPGNRGHAQSVAKYCRLMGQRLGMSRRELDGLSVAAHLHDMGNLVLHHRIGSVTHENETLHLPSYRPTRELLAHVPFPFPVNELLCCAGEDIPLARDGTSPPSTGPALGAQILTIADVYDTLRRGKNDLPGQDALFEWMRRQGSGIFDPEVLEVFVHIRRNERMISTMDIFTVTVLLVDPHPEELKTLRSQLENEDYNVVTAETVEQALEIARSQDVTVVLSELTFQGKDDRFGFLETLKGSPSLCHIPFVFHSRSDTSKIKQGLELGAEDWLPKPHNIEIIAMKLNRLIGRLRSGPNSPMDGVRGNVRDMGMIEMIQILSAANRSVQISIQHNGATAELVVEKGKIICAQTGELAGDQAAIQILLAEEGHFRVLPLKNVPPPNVTMSTDNLVMESCV